MSRNCTILCIILITVRKQLNAVAYNYNPTMAVCCYACRWRAHSRTNGSNNNRRSVEYDAVYKHTNAES